MTFREEVGLSRPPFVLWIWTTNTTDIFRTKSTHLSSKANSNRTAMQLTPFFTALLTALSIVGAASAAIRPSGAPDGVYIHVVDSNGEEHLQYVGAFNSTIGYVIFTVVSSVPTSLTESLVF